ncbi:MAG: thiol peroxidase [Spirochaetales bacterium]|nr:thiol peroxidase [Spirochaetales bacterium]MCF7938387.1 thiol peroxidase [Spirochaetales bacterium]
MSQVTFKGNPLKTSGELPNVGSKAPDFLLTTEDLQDVSLEKYSGKKKILNIVPSLDTGVCAASAKTFDARAPKLDNTVVLTISNDLPFAQARFCSAEGIENVQTLSQLRNRDFGRDYGVEMVSGPLAGLLARAVVVLDENNSVLYTELVPEIAQEPDYDSAVAALK